MVGVDLINELLRKSGEGGGRLVYGGVLKPFVIIIITIIIVNINILETNETNICPTPKTHS